MVWSVCPFCGAGMHGLPNYSDEAAWYALYHPDLPVGSVIPEVCQDCSQNYAPGMQIVERSRCDGELYTIDALICRPNQPPLIAAKRPGSQTRYFAITQIQLYQPPLSNNAPRDERQQNRVNYF